MCLKNQINYETKAISKPISLRTAVFGYALYTNNGWLFLTNSNLYLSQCILLIVLHKQITVTVD